MANAPLVPPDLDEIRRLLRPQISSIPQILADWPRGEGPLADVPLVAATRRQSPRRSQAPAPASAAFFDAASFSV